MPYTPPRRVPFWQRELAKNIQLLDRLSGMQMLTLWAAKTLAKERTRRLYRDTLR